MYEYGSMAIFLLSLYLFYELGLGRNVFCYDSSNDVRENASFTEPSMVEGETSSDDGERQRFMNAMYLQKELCEPIEHLRI